MQRISRRDFVRRVGCGVGCATALTACGQVDRRARAADAGATVRGDPATTYDPNLYLFVDDHWIERRDYVDRVLHQARPLPAPVVWPDDPRHEEDAAWGNVLREPDGTFRMWYATLMLGHAGGGHHEMARAGVWGRADDFGFYPRSRADVVQTNAVLGKYAESSDGRSWAKPELGLVELRGSTRNNIVLNGTIAANQTGGALTNFDGWTVVRDDHETDSNRRYKMVAHWESIHCHDNKDISGFLGRPEAALKRFHAARGKYLTCSRDGLRWDQPLERIDFPDGNGDRFLIVRDHRNERWFGYSRAASHAAAAFSFSQNLSDWSSPEVEPLVTAKSIGDLKVECLVPFNYGRQDLGVPVAMDKDRSMLQGARAMVPYLATHHDGESWSFVGQEREPLIPKGPPSSYYASGAVPLHNEPFIVGDELLIFFNAFARYQDPPSRYGSRSIGIATLRRDGFVGLVHRASAGTGAVVTKEVVVDGPRLELNVEAAPTAGRVEVAVLSPEGTVVPGYDFDSVVPLEVDSVRASVTWAGRNGTADLMGKRVKLAMRLRGDVTLYAFAFAGR